MCGIKHAMVNMGKEEGNMIKSRKGGGTGKHIKRKGRVRGRKRIRADFKLEI